ncbi:MAG: metalloregulator ArsR/SmtB family transcription factor [Candidatus Altiarchaeota archaeon]|nr:metalloregulator ArsR/SmtB family transcription factor [Candidatus Altiarchaeota archaeon]
MAKTDVEMSRCLALAPKVRKRLLPKGRILSATRKLKLFSNPIRLQILSILSGGDTCVCVMSSVLGKGQPTISQHLSILRQGGLIECYSVGKLVFYRLCDRGIRDFLRDL